MSAKRIWRKAAVLAVLAAGAAMLDLEKPASAQVVYEQMYVPSRYKMRINGRRVRGVTMVPVGSVPTVVATPTMVVAPTTTVVTPAPSVVAPVPAEVERTSYVEQYAVPTARTVVTPTTVIQTSPVVRSYVPTTTYVPARVVAPVRVYAPVVPLPY